MIEIVPAGSRQLRQLAWSPRFQRDGRSLTALLRDAGRLSPPSRVGLRLLPLGERFVVVRYEPTAELLAHRPALPVVALLALRWKTLMDSLFPIALGLGIVERAPLLPALAVAGTALFLHAAVNLFSEASQHVQGVDALLRSGGSKVLQMGWVTAWQVAAAGFAMALAAALMLAIVATGHPSSALLAITVLGTLVAWQHGGAPLRLNRTPGGDLVLLAVFGPLLTAGAVVAVGGAVVPEVAVTGATAAAAAGVRRQLRATQRLPDDAMLGRRTLAVALGFARSKRLIAAFGLLLALGPAGGWAAGLAPDRALAALLFGPPLVWALRPAMYAPAPHHPALARAERRLDGLLPVYAMAMIWAWI